MVRLPLALLAITSADVFEVSLPIGGEAELRCSVDDASDAPLQAFGDGVLRELAGEHEADRGLDLAGRERRLLGEAAELGGLEGDALEDVVDERVHDRHACARYP